MKDLKKKIYKVIFFWGRWFLSRLHYRSKFFKFIDKVIMLIIKEGYYSGYEAGLLPVVKHVDSHQRKLTLGFMNLNLCGRNVYIGLYYAIRANQQFLEFGRYSNHGNQKIFIGIGKTDEREFSLFNNCLFHNDITLSSFLEYIEPNLDYLLAANYLDTFIDLLIVNVWDMNLDSNRHIKLRNFNSKRTGIASRNLLNISKKYYSTNSSKNWKNIINNELKNSKGFSNLTGSDLDNYLNDRDLNSIHKNYLSKIANRRDFTPLKRKHVNSQFKNVDLTKLLKIFTIDIETMQWCDNYKSLDLENKGSAKYPKKTQFQVPVLVSLAYLNNSKHIKICFLINRDLIKNKGIDFAINSMWNEVFDYLTKTLNELKLKKVIIFSHNLGSFDGNFIFKGWIHLFDRHSIHSVIDKEHDFIQIIANINNIQLIFKDSLRIFNVSLDDLCKEFGVKGKKSSYNPIWNDFSLFNDVILTNKFIKYALQDSLAILEALLEAQYIYWDTYGVDLATIWSTSTLSLKIFRSRFLDKVIPSLTQAQDFYIRKSYFGGATDHYKRYGENLYYYDVNSLYPSVMIKPMPFLHLFYLNSISENDFKHFFGFCLAEITCPKDIKIPLLPYRNMNNQIIYPTGTWTGIYFSELLKEVMKHGYIVKPINGHEFSKENVFNKYVHYFYHIKKTTSGIAKFIAKMHLNQLYGYFGRNQEIIVTRNVDKNELEELLQTRIIDTIVTIHDNLFIVLLKGNLNHKLIKDLNYTLDLKDFKHLDRSVKSNVAIASAVTAYAQMEMIKYKTMPNHTIYYSDTDSMFLDKSLPEDLIGDELGKVKNELVKLKGESISKAYFLGNKQYGYTFTDFEGKIVEKSVFAGVKKDSLTFKEITTISQNKPITKTFDNTFTRCAEKFSKSGYIY